MKMIYFLIQIDFNTDSFKLFNCDNFIENHVVNIAEKHINLIVFDYFILHLKP